VSGGVVYSCPYCGDDLEDDSGLLYCTRCERVVPAGELRGNWAYVAADDDE
jgi:hypothetical protein